MQTEREGKLARQFDVFRIRPARLREGRWGDDVVMGQRHMGCIAEVRPPHSRSMQVKAA
jgi:hypothetical protein